MPISNREEWIKFLKSAEKLPAGKFIDKVNKLLVEDHESMRKFANRKEYKKIAKACLTECLKVEAGIDTLKVVAFALLCSRDDLVIRQFYENDSLKVLTSHFDKNIDKKALESFVNKIEKQNNWWTDWNF